MLTVLSSFEDDDDDFADSRATAHTTAKTVQNVACVEELGAGSGWSGSVQLQAWYSICGKRRLRQAISIDSARFTHGSAVRTISGQANAKRFGIAAYL